MVAGGIIIFIFLMDCFYCNLINCIIRKVKSRNMALMVNLIILEQNMSQYNIDGNNVRLMVKFHELFILENVPSSEATHTQSWHHFQS